MCVKTKGGRGAHEAEATRAALERQIGVRAKAGTNIRARMIEGGAEIRRTHERVAYLTLSVNITVW
jgi:hypothetical protein